VLARPMTKVRQCICWTSKVLSAFGDIITARIPTWATHEKRPRAFDGSPRPRTRRADLQTLIRKHELPDASRPKRSPKPTPGSEVPESA